MSVIYNNDVEEQELYRAYGMIVYGKINRYVWTIYPDREDDDCLITFRVAREDGDDVIDYYLGNNVISLNDYFNTTIDNFLYWIAKESPDKYNIESVIRKTLCATDCLFNHRISNMKYREKMQAAERERTENIRKEEIRKQNYITQKCNEKKLVFTMADMQYCVLKPLTEDASKLLKDADKSRMELYVKFAEKYPDNKQLKVITKGHLDDVYEYMEDK